jgi:hypothetical protein
MVLSKLKAGMTVYTLSPKRRFQPQSYYPVQVKEIDEQTGRVLASINNNPPSWCHKNIWSKWRLTPPGRNGVK